MAEPKTTDDELLSIQEVADRLKIAESTAWLLVKRHNLPRYRLAGRGKTVFFQWSDVDAAYKTPVQVGGSRSGKTEALAA